MYTIFRSHLSLLHVSQSTNTDTKQSGQVLIKKETATPFRWNQWSAGDCVCRLDMLSANHNYMLSLLNCKTGIGCFTSKSAVQIYNLQNCEVVDIYKLEWPKFLYNFLSNEVDTDMKTHSAPKINTSTIDYWMIRRFR